MVHEAIGNWGHLFVVVSFVAALIAAIGYSYTAYLTEKNKTLTDVLSWKRFSRVVFFVHSFAVFGIVFCLYYIISHHFYEYHYAWSHSSNDLPWYFMLSCFWEGQEGSFLLWIFWQVWLGLILIRVNKTWEAPLLAVFSLVQAFLVSMIIGGAIPGIDIKIGSSPFILLKEYMGNIPVYLSNPDFIPKDGTGLNLLLQNYWMVIHPPTLFLGFASTLVPFSYCIAGLWKKQYSEWIRPALPWALFSALILGVGILMGGYWAYETLNFGGYWNWDPVENAVLVPWLVLIGGIHLMISYKNTKSSLKTAMILIISTFLLVLYSTYLTRSGVLGESSVHSFTDLGLKNQLFLYLVAFVALALVLLIKAWKEIPAIKKELNIYSREFWVFIGALVLCLSAFQIIIPTSIPFFNSILKSLGIDSNMAPPAEQAAFYGKWQIWFAMLVALLSGIGQFFWWKTMDAKKLKKSLYQPIVISLLLSALLILAIDLSGLDSAINSQSHYLFLKLKFILLWTCAIFSIVANAHILWGLLKTNYKLSGGAVAHIGFSILLLGVLFSAGYSKVISLNTTGLLFSKEADESFNTENMLLWRNDPAQMGSYELTYKGKRLQAKDFPGYVDEQKVFQTENPLKGIATEDIYWKGKKYFSKGDTLHIQPKNTYYEVAYKNKKSGEAFTLYPRIQSNPGMGGKIVSPDIRRFWNKDFYTHITSFIEDKDREWSPEKEFTARVGDTLIINDYIAIFKGVEKETALPGVSLGPNDGIIKAHFVLLGKNRQYDLYPRYLVKIEKDEKGRQNILLGQIPEVLPDLGLRVSFLSIHPATETFTFSESTTQKDFIIMKVVEKPLINLLWIGAFIVVLGLLMAISRRYSEFKKMRDKEPDTLPLS